MENLLKILEEGRAFSQTELAQKLNLSVETLGAQIDYLEHLGLLRRIGHDCECGGCTGCASKCKNGGITPPTMWERA